MAGGQLGGVNVARARRGQRTDHVLTHAHAIRGPGVELPEDMQAGAAPLTSPDFSRRVLGVSESLPRASIVSLSRVHRVTRMSCRSV